MDRAYIPARRGFGCWWAVALGVVFLAIGLALGAGGVWLIALGGSWYYLFAGLGLIVAGALMTTHRRSGANRLSPIGP